MNRYHLEGKTYQQRKESVRQLAINYQTANSNNTMPLADVAFFGNLFEELGRRYGLLTEFRENGII